MAAMSPVSTVVRAVADGIDMHGRGLSSPATLKAYMALKALLARNGEVLNAVVALEREAASQAEEAALARILAEQRVADDAEIVEAARKLLRALRHRRRTGIGGVRILGVPPEHDDAEYTVWYGTNRRPVDPSDAGKGYSARRDDSVHYGSCRVFVPKGHRFGSLGSSWWKRLFTGDDRLRLLRIEALESAGYWRTIAAHLETVERAGRQAVVFVHGYNVSFQKAALRAAQIGFDLKIRGAMAFFSWPSRGRLGPYLADAAAIEASEGAITDFLVDFADRSGANAVHIVAHSMGNRGVLRAVDRIAQQARKRSGKRFGQVMLAAADVDADLFRQLCAAYVQLAQRTTLYVSTRDRAVEASHWLHDFPRVGLMPPVFVAPGIDTVNVANVDLTRLGHGYVAEARSVLQDMHELIVRGAPPLQRFGLLPAEAPDGGRFWIIGA